MYYPNQPTLPLSVAYFQPKVQNEEIYIILKGKGIFTIDDDKIEVKEGSCIKVMPCTSRTIKSTGSEELQFICIQAKTNSLEQFGLGDAELC